MTKGAAASMAILFTAICMLFPVACHAQVSEVELRARQLEDAKQVLMVNTVMANEKTPFADPRDQFYVNGSNIPDVDWDVGTSYAGLLPISNLTDETRKLFFWYFPPGPQGSPDDLIFWTNGGPGCSSLEGLLQENGPFSWSWGTYKPIQNEHSWTNLSGILWVEQPVGVGFTQGTADIKDEVDLASQVVGFLQQFLEVFSELKGKNLYVSGESYAGAYVPYIADYIYENPGLIDLDLKGIWIADPLISWSVVQQQIPVVDFVHKYDPVFAFNRTFLAELDARAQHCNYSGYVETYLKYPPEGPLPLPGNFTTADPYSECDVWNATLDAALIVNPAFDYYRIFDTYPILWDVLGFPGSFENIQSPIYFNRTDVKKAINAPLNVNWSLCVDQSVVFPSGDASPPSAFAALPNVIERSARTVIIHGLADFALLPDGARIAIQNMTWNGMQGFQTPIEVDTFIVDGMGALGNAHTERNLTYLEVALSGHMVPQFSPQAAYQSMQYLMGFRDTPWSDTKGDVFEL